MSEPELQRVLAEVRAREPLFHRREFVHDDESFEASTTAGFWEVGASGRVYSREVVRQALRERWRTPLEDDLVAENWQLAEEQIEQIDASTYLFTYLLRQPGRTSRRMSIWQRSADSSWRVAYHQGTVVED